MELGDDALVGALYGQFIGDAIAVPTHWYYSHAVLSEEIASRYADSEGYITDFHDVPPGILHPDSWNYFQHCIPQAMHETTNANSNSSDDNSNIGSGTANASSGSSVVVDTSAWESPGAHYHRNLKAGQCSVTGQLAGVLASVLATEATYNQAAYLDAYVRYFTTGDHGDTYIEGIHRNFFRSLAAGTPPADCGSPDETCLSGLALCLPLMVSAATWPLQPYLAALQSHVVLSHRSPVMQVQVQQLGLLLRKLMLLRGEESSELTAATTGTTATTTATATMDAVKEAIRETYGEVVERLGEGFVALDTALGLSDYDGFINSETAVFSVR